MNKPNQIQEKICWHSQNRCSITIVIQFISMIYKNSFDILYIFLAKKRQRFLMI